MSDHFQMLVDADASPAEGENVVKAVLDRFRNIGLIAGEASPECVLQGTGYRPGPAIGDLYHPGKREGRFWELVTCGVQPETGRSFNQWAIGPDCEGFTCPCCQAQVEPFDEEFGDAFGNAIGAWMDSSGPTGVECPECRKEIPVNQWECVPPLGFGNVSFQFWNWPSFDSPAWKINIVGIVREVTGHDIVKTHGRL